MKPWIPSTRPMLMLLLMTGVFVPTQLTPRAEQSNTIPVTAHLTADNHYALYYGDDTGTVLTLVGRNEHGYAGNPGGSPWNLPETWEFFVDADDYLYVVAWDDGDSSFPISMWIGDFVTRGGLLVSNHESWESKPMPAVSPGPFGDPGMFDVASAISSGNWSKPQAEAANLPGMFWGGVPGVDTSATLLWHNPFWGTSTIYVIYRAPVSALRHPKPCNG